MPTPGDAIRALRERSNAAIAARDAELVTSFMDDEVTVAVAGGPVLRGVEENRRAWASQMREPGFGGYVRTPASVHVHDGRTRATERGTWMGTWRLRGARHQQRGSYVAEWALGPLGWRIVSEEFREGER